MLVQSANWVRWSSSTWVERSFNVGRQSACLHFVLGQETPLISAFYSVVTSLDPAGLAPHLRFNGTVTWVVDKAIDSYRPTPSVPGSEKIH